MNTKFLGIALLASATTIPALYQEAFAASYSYDGIEYTWTCYGDTCDTSEGSAYIDQYRIYVLPGINGVDYKAIQVADTSSSQLTAIGFYENGLLSSYLNEGSAAITDSGDGVSFAYDPSPSNLPDHTLAFGAADNDPPVANGLNLINEWVNINFEYIAGKTEGDFLANAMFSADHYIYVHLQTTPHPTTGIDDSEKWRLTWQDEGGGGGQEVPEPAIAGLMGIGLFSLALVSARKVAC